MVQSAANAPTQSRPHLRCNSATVQHAESLREGSSLAVHACIYALRQAVWLSRIRPPTGKLLHSCLRAMLQAVRRSSSSSCSALQLRLGRFSGGFPRPSKQQMDQPSQDALWVLVSQLNDGRDRFSFRAASML